MGQDYKCGCRESFGHVFPCKTHKEMLEKEWEKVGET
jgi:hypothetical protein